MERFEDPRKLDSKSSPLSPSPSSSSSSSSSSRPSPDPNPSPTCQYEEVIAFPTETNTSAPFLPSAGPVLNPLPIAWNFKVGSLSPSEEKDRKPPFRTGEPVVFSVANSIAKIYKRGIVYSSPLRGYYHLNWDNGGGGLFCMELFLDYPSGFVPAGERLPLLKEGDRVEYRLDERFHPGIVLKRLPEFKYEVGFGREGKREVFKEEDLRLYPLFYHKFGIGDDVDARWKGSDIILRGTISGENGNHHYSVAFQGEAIDPKVEYAEIFLVNRPPENSSLDSVAQILRGDVVYFKSKLLDVDWVKAKVTFVNADGTLALLSEKSGELYPSLAPEFISFVERPLMRKSSNVFKEFKVGDLVRAKWKGHHYFSGKIVAIHEDGCSYAIDFIEKPREEKVPYFDIVLSKKAEEEDLPPAKGLRLGDPVDAKYKGGEFMPGWIVAINPDGTYAVEFDDGVLEFNQPASQIRKVEIMTGGSSISSPLKHSGKFFPGQKVKAKWRDGLYHLAKIAAENFDGTFAVRFNDNTYESHVPSAHITTDLGESDGDSLFPAESTQPSIAPKLSSSPSASSPFTFSSKDSANTNLFTLSSSSPPAPSPQLRPSSPATSTSLKPSNPQPRSAPTPVSPRGASDKTYRVFENGTKVLSVNNWRYFKDGVKFGEVWKQHDGSYRIVDINGDFVGEWKKSHEVMKGSTEVADFDGKELRLASEKCYLFEGGTCFVDGKAVFDLEGVDATDPIPAHLIGLWIALFKESH